MADAVIAISTFRRTGLLRECLDSLTKSPYEIHVVVPEDEWGQHSFDPWRAIKLHKLPMEHVGKGAGAPRWFMGERLKDLSFDHVIWCDDDIKWFDQGAGAEHLVESLKKHPFLAQVQINKAETLKTHYDEIVGKGGVNTAGMCWSMRTSDYFRAGGFDPSMSRKEDVDLGYRIQLFGGINGRLINQVCHHRKFRPEGGMAEFEKSLPGENRFIRAKENDMRMSFVTMSKFPPRSFSINPHGIIVLRQAALKVYRQMVANGEVAVNVDGILNGALECYKGAKPEPYLNGALKETGLEEELYA